MLVSSGRVKRGLLCTVFALAALAVVSVASASAAITTTSITSPSSPFVYTFDTNATPTPTVTISGTTDSTAPGSDKVDINCYYTENGSIDHDTIASGIALNPDGTFSWTGAVADDDTCTLRAVPSGYGDTYPNVQFTGPSSVLNETQLFPVSGSSAPYYDYWYTGSSTNAFTEYYSVGECGLDYAEPIQPNGDFVEWGSWDCADGLYSGDGSGQRSEIQIDGSPAYDSRGAYDLDSALGNFPALSSSYSNAASASNLGGDVTINESEALVKCGSAYPFDNSNCGGAGGAWQGTGVSFARKISQTQGGQVVTITDTYSSTDGASHSLDLEYDNYVDNDGDAGWKLPGSSTYNVYSPGDQATLPNRSAGVIEAGDPYYLSDNGFDSPAALIYSTQPNLVKFRPSCCSTPDQDMLLNYQRTVPAGGSLSITQTYVDAPTQASLDKIVNAALDSVYRPTVSITSPANNTLTSASSVQVSGTASANEGLSLKVNGAAVPVNSDGKWSTSVSLHDGTNTITAVASDGSGNAAQVSETVYYNLKGAFCVVPNVSHMKLAKAKDALKAAGCKVGKVHKLSSKMKKGHVLHASYSAHVVLSRGTKVGLTVSNGKPHHKKHNVRDNARIVFDRRRH